MKNHTNAKFTLAAAAIAALFAVGSFSASADDVKAGGPSDKPGRALDDGPMKSEGASSKSGRVPAINDDVKPGGVKKYSRAASGATDKPGSDRRRGLAQSEDRRGQEATPHDR